MRKFKHHVTVALLTLAASYDIFAINIAATMLGYVYGHTSQHDTHFIYHRVITTS